MLIYRLEQGQDQRVIEFLRWFDLLGKSMAQQVYQEQ